MKSASMKASRPSTMTAKTIIKTANCGLPKESVKLLQSTWKRTVKRAVESAVLMVEIRPSKCDCSVILEKCQNANPIVTHANAYTLETLTLE